MRLDKTLTVRLSDDDSRRVEHFCRINHLDKAGLIRSIIRALDTKSSNINTKKDPHKVCQ